MRASCATAPLYNLNYALGKPDPEEVAEADGAVSVAQAALEEAQRQYDRVKNGPNPDVLKQAEANLTNAEAQVDSASQTLADLELKAPFDGVVSQIKVRTGEWVIAGQPVMMLADLAHLQVETTDLSEIDVARLDVGNAAVVTFDALPDVEVQGVVQSIAPKSDEGAGVNYRVVIRLNEIPDKLRWGMTAFVDITVSE
jgi:RND family efflux transporter MFP subunit